MSTPQKVRFNSYLVLAAPASWTAIGVMAKNPVGIPHAERLIGLSLLIWGSTCLVVWIGVRLGTGARPTVFAVFMGTVMFMSGRELVDRYGFSITLLALVGVVAAVYWLTSRLSDSSLPDVLLVGLAVALISGPAADFYDSVTTRGSSSAVRPPSVGAEIADRRDIFLIVLDGHPGLQAIEFDYGPGVVESIVAEMGEAGYQLPDSAWTSFRATAYSIPSLLSMAYPTENPTGTPAETQDMYEIVAGDNSLRRILEGEGYVTHMLESGWSGSSCREYDHCVASPLLDESMFLAIHGSVLGEPILERYGYAFTAGAMNAMEWLETNVPALDADQAPDFVFAHIMAPHPPFFLDHDCQLVVTSDRSGVRFSRSGVSINRRSDFMLDQIACLQGFLTELAANVSEDGIIVVVSDHGSDRRNQLAKALSDWTEADIVERMNAYLAVKSPDGCHIGEGLVVPNVMRRVLTCLAAEPVPDLAPRMFLGEGLELSSEKVVGIVSLGASSG